MSNSIPLTTQYGRPSLIDYIVSTLVGFKRTGDRFEREFVISQHSVMIINGRPISAPPIRCKHACELLGSGHIEDESGRKDEFELIAFELHTGDQIRHLHTNIYYNEYWEFSNIVKQLFNI